ncbi:hypothetical protein E2562_034619 [Oryza meyeriana var. granulata]|uniref:Uncharacterized protein n=1 Tax=Oryza meyeriana var. granulata TaxID=110450 RepID=A0A6G1E6K5_9ORYZ|nr:hypothetical protein E2562_034619 [Oryza meyeriana var. granulata]
MVGGGERIWVSQLCLEKWCDGAVDWLPFIGEGRRKTTGENGGGHRKALQQDFSRLGPNTEMAQGSKEQLIKGVLALLLDFLVLLWFLLN